MRKVSLAARGLAVFLALPALAQLTTDQRLADFRHLADLVARKYGPYQWKRDALKFDALAISSWLERVRRAKDDLDFYQVSVEYIASLNDAHSCYYLPSTFYASLGFTVDVYEGKVLIDSINRDRLPEDRYPFQIGDELVAVDGKKTEDLLREYQNYWVAGNPRSTARFAAALIVSRGQAYMPRAHEIGDEAEILVRRADSSEERYKIAWRKSGAPVTQLGPVPSPRTAGGASTRGPREPEPAYREPLARLEYFALPERPMVLNRGARSPVFTLPETFLLRRGGARTDSFYSGTYTAEDLRIGFIRIPTFSYLSPGNSKRKSSFLKRTQTA